MITPATRQRRLLINIKGNLIKIYNKHYQPCPQPVLFPGNYVFYFVKIFNFNVLIFMFTEATTNNVGAFCSNVDFLISLLHFIKEM